MNEPKTYVPKTSAKEIKFPPGGSMLKLGFHVDTLIEFVRKHANDRGYINFGVTSRRQVSEHGETHSVWLDTWKPKAAGQSSPKPPTNAKPPEEDDVPF